MVLTYVCRIRLLGVFCSRHTSTAVYSNNQRTYLRSFLAKLAQKLERSLGQCHIVTWCFW